MNSDAFGLEVGIRLSFYSPLRKREREKNMIIYRLVCLLVCLTPVCVYFLVAAQDKIRTDVIEKRSARCTAHSFHSLFSPFVCESLAIAIVSHSDAGRLARVHRFSSSLGLSRQATLAGRHTSIFINDAKTTSDKDYIRRQNRPCCCRC